MEIVPWIITALAALSLGLLGWFVVSGIKIKNGWQNGESILAKWLDERRRAKFNEQLPEALSTMSNALRAGLAVSQAFDAVIANGEKPISDEFAILVQQLHVGMSFENAMEAMAKRVGSDDLALVTTALIVARRTGGNVTEIFDKIADTIRARMRVERRVRTLTAQGRMQGLIVSAMPVFLAVIMTIIKPRLMIPFLCSLTGVVCIVATVVLITLGWLVIRKIIKIDV